MTSDLPTAVLRSSSLKYCSCWRALRDTVAMYAHRILVRTEWRRSQGCDPKEICRPLSTGAPKIWAGRDVVSCTYRLGALPRIAICTGPAIPSCANSGELQHQIRVRGRLAQLKRRF